MQQFNTQLLTGLNWSIVNIHLCFLFILRGTWCENKIFVNILSFEIKIKVCRYVYLKGQFLQKIIQCKNLPNYITGSIEHSWQVLFYFWLYMLYWPLAFPQILSIHTTQTTQLFIQHSYRAVKNLSCSTIILT